MLLKKIFLLVFLIQILSGCIPLNENSTNVISYRVIGETTNPVFEKLNKSATNSKDSKFKIFVENHTVSKEDIAYNSLGVVTAYNVSVKMNIKIESETEILFQRSISTSKNLKNLNKSSADEEIFNRAISELYERIFLRIKRVLINLNET